MLFSELVDRLYLLTQRTKRLEITEQLAAIFAQASPEEARCITYLVQGEVRPSYQGQTIFGLAERSLRSLVVRMLTETEGLSEARIGQIAAKSVDLAEAIQDASWEPYNGGGVTIRELYDQLVALSEVSGTGSQDLRAERVVTLMLCMRPIDAAFVIRIILGKLRLGFSDMTILDALSWLEHGNKSQRVLLEEAFNVCADLGDIAEQVRRGGVGSLGAVHMRLGVPVRPAAAERLPSAEEIIAKIGPCVVQPKLDGFRVQVHTNPRTGMVHFFSRNLQRMDDMFPEVTDAWVSCQHAVVIDAEAIAYDEENDRYLPFQETVKRRRKHDIAVVAAEYPLKLIAFDLLYLDGTELIAHAHHERYALLQALIGALPAQAVQVISVIPEQAVETAQQLESYFASQVEQGFEGVVVKRDSAEYQAGKRNFNWIKLKRQTIGVLEDTIDAVVLGYYYGRGKRAQLGIGACLVGVYDVDNDSFVTIAKLGTGLSDADWRDLKKQADRYKVAHKPARVVCADSLAPDIWVDPAIVLEIAADEITRSPVHTAAWDSETEYGLALRFPRMTNFRPDKDADDVTTVHELRELFEQQSHQRIEQPDE